ncbi:MAG: NAD-dependent epimerase/dehydratase family protein [Cyanobacteria bacterium P01_A01_bin.135]
MRLLVMGGTRFIGVYLVKRLVQAGHEVVLLNRGKSDPPLPDLPQIHCDRKDSAALKAELAGERFDAVFDNNGRSLSDTQTLVEALGGNFQQLIYVSSAGVYLKSDQMPHVEGDPVDPKSRHLGKHETEAYLAEQGLPFTSVRPVYIYGPQNYNDIEAWFFDRILRDRPVPIPGNGMHLTQMGHVDDLAAAMVAMLGCEPAKGKIYNISGERAVTFDGLARACAMAANKSPEDVPLVHYDPADFDFGKRKAFPLRMQHFFTDIHSAKTDLGWSPAYDLVAGLADSLQRDYLASGRNGTEVDFSLDDEIMKAMA